MPRLTLPSDADSLAEAVATAVRDAVAPVEAIGIPRAAILSDQGGNYVWVIGDGNKAESRRIQLGQSTPETAIVSSGIKDGETVVVDGIQRVRPGAVVNPGPAAVPPSLTPKT